MSTSESYIAIPAKLLDRVVGFVRRALIKSGADTIAVFALVKGRDEEKLCSFPVEPNSDPDELARELARVIDESAEEAERFRLAGFVDGEDKTSLVVQSRQRPAGKGALSLPGNKSLLNGDARDYQMSAAVRGYAELVALVNKGFEARENSSRQLIEDLTARNLEMTQDAMNVAREASRLAREDREGKARERMDEVRTKALSDTAGELQKAIPMLTAGVAKWAGFGGAGQGGPPGVIADALRSLRADQIVKLPALLGESRATAIVRAWDYVKRGGDPKEGLEILAAVKAALRDLEGAEIAALQAILDTKQMAAVVAAWEDVMKEGAPK